MNSKLKSTVIDAGGRFGLHPTWKPFTGELEYYLFEPDNAEATRLSEKYRVRHAEVKVVASALGNSNQNIQINLFQNRAMSSSVKRNPVSSLFKGERRGQVEIEQTVEVNATSIDSFADEKGLHVDFLKLDTEGTEFEILEGANHQLLNCVLGVRSEIQFDHIFEGMPLFGEVNKRMLDLDFYLLNIDYDGRGDNQNNFVRLPGRYGILTSSDAVWMKRPATFFSLATQNDYSLEVQVLKYAAFCLMNSANDVALSILLEARTEYKVKFDKTNQTRLYRFVDNQVKKLFYDLKWQPGQSLKECQDTYRQIFGKEMEEVHEFMQSLELNPD